MLSENSFFLKKYLSSYIDKLPLEAEPEEILVEESRSGHPTMKIKKNERYFYFHSRHRPTDEAETIINKYSEKIKNSKHVLFYGIGMGYHIDSFIGKFPDKAFTLYEPKPEIVAELLKNRRISHWATKRIKEFVVEDSIEVRDQFIYNFLEKMNGEVTLIILPAYERIFNERCNEFSQKFSEGIKDWRNHLFVNLAFQKRWIVNGLKNFPTVLNSPNIMHDINKDLLRDKPAIIVSAGPSLSEDLEELKYIKENRLAYIFAVGSAINALIESEIYPDAAFTYDPKEKNYTVFEKVKKNDITTIPLVFGSSVGYETLQDYPGRMLHFITSQDTIAARYLKRENDNEVALIVDSPSIAVMTFQILSKLGCNPIVLTGQNLAYRDKKWYAKEISGSEISEEADKESLLVKSVDGEMIQTNEDFNRMRVTLESYIEQNPSIQVINTTVKGAQIKGTAFLRIKEVINNILTSAPVEDFNKVIDNLLSSYDVENIKKDFIEQQFSKELKETYQQAERALDKLQHELKVTKNFSKMQKQYVKFIKYLKAILENDCFVVFIMPIMQIQFNLFVQGLNDLHIGKSIIEEIQTSLPSYIKFLEEIKSSMDVILPIYQEVAEELASAQIK